MKKPFKGLPSLKNVDLSRAICNHLIGEGHSNLHRYSVGFIIMTVGVGLTKVVFIFDVTAIHIFGDIIGYAIHGIGAVPFVEKVLTTKNKE